MLKCCTTEWQLCYIFLLGNNFCCLHLILTPPKFAVTFVKNVKLTQRQMLHSKPSQLVCVYADLADVSSHRWESKVNQGPKCENTLNGNFSNNSINLCVTLGQPKFLMTPSLLTPDILWSQPRNLKDAARGRSYFDEHPDAKNR